MIKKYNSKKEKTTCWGGTRRTAVQLQIVKTKMQSNKFVMLPLIIVITIPGHTVYSSSTIILLYAVNRDIR